MFWYGAGMGWWGYVLMTISMIVFWGLLIAGVVALVRYAGRGPLIGPGGEQPRVPAQGQAPAPHAPPPATRPTPDDVLAERFARGEIDEDEYRHRLDVLHATGSASARH
ncbi:SHOCT domain-containing protein [Actinopolymorpha singaporensis]|uniref:Putative membrane protein n=1 Tax=Actinopolymorpha singaporensis TaxID=117157 RepID=A0A1H1L8A1_9ACTN|nr:SHOCT domain-containing protein [Actinopolymorpha singaporensis]SDR70821.1 putative membrane protein [Actinopolymorpha singaporensis]